MRLSSRNAGWPVLLLGVVLAACSEDSVGPTTPENSVMAVAVQTPRFRQVMAAGITPAASPPTTWLGAGASTGTAQWAMALPSIARPLPESAQTFGSARSRRALLIPVASPRTTERCAGAPWLAIVGFATYGLDIAIRAV
jgi:hypothetical protein